MVDRMCVLFYEHMKAREKTKGIGKRQPHEHKYETPCTLSQ